MKELSVFSGGGGGGDRFRETNRRTTQMRSRSVNGRSFSDWKTHAYGH
jgi:hypothetical protein